MSGIMTRESGAVGQYYNELWGCPIQWGTVGNYGINGKITLFSYIR